MMDVKAYQEELKRLKDKRINDSKARSVHRLNEAMGRCARKIQERERGMCAATRAVVPSSSTLAYPEGGCTLSLSERIVAHPTGHEILSARRGYSGIPRAKKKPRP